jgi:O-antigen/teichoic acid export membrane protein
MIDQTGMSAEERRRARIPLKGRSLREHAARGTVINAGFSIALAGVGSARLFLIAIFLTAADYGVWGLIYLSVVTVLWLKEIGIGDKFIQQDELDQELAYQKAFTINLVWTLIFAAVILVAVPLFALAYGRPEIILPGCALAFGVIGTAFQTAKWIFGREMRFLRSRVLDAIDPITAFVVTLALGFAGLGYWALVIGAVVSTWTAAIATLIASPYPLRLRWDRQTLSGYVSFGWPLMLAGGSGLLVVQAAMTVGNYTVGLAGVGAIGLSGTIANFANRVDGIVTGTLYPAICAVKDRVDLLAESFVKSNRLALIWGMPFGLGLTLFAPDIVKYVLGEKWDATRGLLQVFGVTTAVTQIGFNWTAYHRAIGNTRPIAANSIAALVAFFSVGIPGMILWGLTGYALGVVAMTVTALVVRGYYLARLFSGFQILRHAMRAVTPSIPAVMVVLAARLVEPDGRPAGVVIAELVLYAFTTLLATWILERQLLREAVGYLRGGLAEKEVTVAADVP